MRDFNYTKLADYKWDNTVVTYIAKIHECKGRQEFYVQQRPTELERLTEFAKIQSTEASNKIEGIITTDTRLRQLMLEKAAPRNRDESEILGYRDVLNTIHESYDYISLKPNNILQLHRDLLKHAGLGHAGKFKSVQNYIVEATSDGGQHVRFVPMAPYETPEAIDKICESYTQALNAEAVDALILIPAFICDFLCIHPFNDGNGRMSRLLTLLLLYQSGYDVGKYISIEKRIEKTKDDYYIALEQSGIGWQEEANDPTPFIKYMLEMLLACYVEFEERIATFGEYGKRRTTYDVVKAYMMGTLGKMTGAEVIAACPSAKRSSILAAINRLTEEGLIIRHGAGRSTYYVRADSAIT